MERDMFSGGLSIAHSLFKAINDDNLPELINLLGDDPDLLLFTCNTVPDLENDLIGARDIPCGKYPRVGTDNTLLNFALLLDRVEIALELVNRHIRHNQQMLFVRVTGDEHNYPYYYPLVMAYAMQCEFSVKYEQRQIVVTKFYTLAEKTAREEIAVQMVTLLLNNISQYPEAHNQLRSTLRMPLRRNVIPGVAIQYLRTWCQTYKSDPLIDVDVSAGIGNYLMLLHTKTKIINHAEAKAELESMIQNIHDAPQWDSPRRKDETIAQTRARFKFGADLEFQTRFRFQDIIIFIELLRADADLNEQLNQALCNPYIAFDDRNLFIDAPSSTGPMLIFQLIYCAHRDNFAEDFRGVHNDLQKALMLLSSPLQDLTNAQGTKLSKYLHAFKKEKISQIPVAMLGFIDQVKSALTEYEMLNPAKIETAKRAPLLKEKLQKIAAAVASNDYRTANVELLYLQVLVSKFKTSETYNWGHYFGKHAGGLDTLLQKHLATNAIVEVASSAAASGPAFR
jgi:hypothetical protein